MWYHIVYIKDNSKSSSLSIYRLLFFMEEYSGKVKWLKKKVIVYMILSCVMLVLAGIVLRIDD